MNTSASEPPTVELPCIAPLDDAMSVHQHEQLVSGLDRLAAVLPPMPGIIARLQQELSNEWVNIQRLGNLVRSDPTLAGSVLRVANSPYWRGSRQIVEIEEAIQRMGMETLRSLTVVMTLKSATSTDHGPAGATLRDYWKHSLLVAVGSVQIARNSPIDRRGLEQVWMAGLVHDIGALLAPMLYPLGWTRVMQAIEPAPVPAPPSGEGSDMESTQLDPASVPVPPKLDLFEIERMHMGIDHGHIGAVFVQRQWNLPEPIPMIVDTWTDPSRLAPPMLPWIIARADQAAQVLGFCWQPEQTRARDLDALPKESGAGPACDPELCLNCVEKSVALVDAILS